MDKKIVTIVVVAAALIAVVVAVGLLLQDHGGANEDKHKIVSGDRVSVNYTETLYAYYGEENAAVFDTSYETVAKDPTVLKANDFSVKPPYSTLDFVVDNKNSLKIFKEAVDGHYAGDIVKVRQAAEEGDSATFETGTLPLKGNIMSNVFPVVASQFKNMHPEVKLEAKTPVDFTASCGWPGKATLSEDGTEVMMEYLPIKGQSYKAYDNTRTTVYYKVTDVGESTIMYDIEIHDPVYLDGTSIQMLKLDMGSRNVYITALEDDHMSYKFGKEAYGQPLYYLIEIVSVNA